MAMFFAVELEKAKLERVVTWILVIYVVVHVVSHVVLRWVRSRENRKDWYSQVFDEGMYQLLQLFDNFVFRSLIHDFLSSINICWAETPSAIDVHPLSGFCNHNIELDSQYRIVFVTITHMRLSAMHLVHPCFTWAKIPSVTDASAPRFHQCSPNYKYQQLLSFMAV